jgi:hypothetical protein
MRSTHAFLKTRGQQHPLSTLKKNVASKPESYLNVPSS